MSDSDSATPDDISGINEQELEDAEVTNILYILIIVRDNCQLPISLHRLHKNFIPTLYHNMFQTIE